MHEGVMLRNVIVCSAWRFYMKYMCLQLSQCSCAVFVSSSCKEQCLSLFSVRSERLNNFLVLIKANLNVKMLKIHSANLSPFSKVSFQLIGKDMVHVFWGWSGVFSATFFKRVLLFHLLSPVPGMLLKPSEPQWTVIGTHFPSHHPLFFLQQNLESDASSCYDLSSCFPFPTEANTYIYIYIYTFFHIFCIAVQFPVLSLLWNSPEWCSCCSERGTDFVLLKCIYWSLLLHLGYSKSVM